MRILLAVLVSAVVVSPASACCLFPFFPTYSPGYYGWSNPTYSAGYAPIPYGGYAYSASYGGFSSGDGCCASTSCCPTSCCPTSCCDNSCGSGGCSSGSCGSANTISSGVRKEPIPDPLSDRRDVDPLNSSPSSRDSDGGRYNDPVRDPMDEFSRPGTSGSSASDLNSSDDRWTPPGTGSRREDSGSTFGSGSNSLNDRSYRSTPGTEAPLFEADPETDFGTPPADSTNRGANKPPMTLPLEESSSPDIPADNGGLGAEAQPDDFLPPESDSESSSNSTSFLSESQQRSSHFDVLSMQRLAGKSSPKRVDATLVSSSQKSQRPAQWISIPLPEGRIRL